MTFPNPFQFRSRNSKLSRIIFLFKEHNNVFATLRSKTIRSKSLCRQCFWWRCQS